MHIFQILLTAAGFVFRYIFWTVLVFFIFIFIFSGNIAEFRYANI